MTDIEPTAMEKYQRTGIASLLDGVEDTGFPPEPPQSWPELTDYGWPNLETVQNYWREQLNRVVEDIAGSNWHERAAHNLDILDGLLPDAPWRPLFVGARTEDHFRVGMPVVFLARDCWHGSTVYTVGDRTVRVGSHNHSFTYHPQDFRVLRSNEFQHLQQHEAFARLWARASWQVHDLDAWYEQLLRAELTLI